MIKAAGKAASNAGPARAFEDIFTNRLQFVSAAHMCTEQGRAALRPPRGGVRMCGA